MHWLRIHDLRHSFATSWSIAAGPCTKCSRSSATATQSDRALRPSIVQDAAGGRQHGQRHHPGRGVEGGLAPPRPLRRNVPPEVTDRPPGRLPREGTRLGPRASVCRSGMVRYPPASAGRLGPRFASGSPAPSALPRPSSAQVWRNKSCEWRGRSRQPLCLDLGCHQVSSHRKTFIQEATT